MPTINRWHSLNNLPFAGNCLMGISEQREIAKDGMDHGDHSALQLALQEATYFWVFPLLESNET